MQSNPVFTYWYFHIPNLMLAALMYTVLGRAVLSLLLPPDTTNYIFRAFVRLTDPVVRLVRAMTPAAVPHVVVLVFTFLWLMVARLALFLGLANAGLMPAVL